MKPRTIAYFELFCLALAIALFFWWISPKEPAPVQTTPTVLVSVKGKPVFHAPPFEAKAVYIYDAAADKVIFENNSSLQLPLASLTKLMTAVTAKGLLPDYVLVRISRENLLEEGDTGLLIGEEWTLGNLLDFSLVASSNDGIQAIAEATGGPV
jgi:D-alanyl-D-alanine carboxypeptidase (penicillin-binding protein 5/6)